MSVEVGVIMGSQSDWSTMKAATQILAEFNVSFESKVISAHRMPVEMLTYAQDAEKRGLKVIIAGAGGAAHLPGMVAANTLLPVIGVPIQSHALNGLDSLLSIVQMPAGIPVATTAIGVSGAKNGALLAISILGLTDESLQKQLATYRKEMHDTAADSSDHLE